MFIRYGKDSKNVEHTNPPKWWKQIKILTGQDKQYEWYYQFLEDSENIKSLANRINDIFISVTDHFQPLHPPVSSVHVPTELLVTE